MLKLLRNNEMETFSDRVKIRAHNGLESAYRGEKAQFLTFR